MRFLNILIGFFCCGAAFYAYACKAKATQPQKAVDFTLLDQDENPTNLSQVLASHAYVVLIFYPQDDSFICTKQMCQLRDIHHELPSDILLLGISSDRPEKHKKFIQKHQLPFRLLSDPHNKVRDLYDAYTWGLHARVTIVVRHDGTIVESHSNLLSLVDHIELVSRLSGKKKTSTER